MENSLNEPIQKKDLVFILTSLPSRLSVFLTIMSAIV